MYAKPFGAKQAMQAIHSMVLLESYLFSGSVAILHQLHLMLTSASISVSAIKIEKVVAAGVTLAALNVGFACAQTSLRETEQERGVGEKKS